MAEMKQMKTLTINDTTYEVVDETARSSANTVNTALTQHVNNTNNPHGVTAAQVGADASGSAAQALTAAKAYTDTHANNKKNPHGVTAAQVGADASGSAAQALANAKAYMDTHANNKENPHSVTAEQVGADASGSAAQALIDAKAYTDSEIEDIQIGGRNLFLNTGEEISNNEPSIATYVPADEPLVAGETYTISMCITPATGVSYFGVLFSRGYKRVARLYPSGNSKQILTSTFIMSYADGRTPEDSTANANCIIRREPDDGTVTENTTIHWIKIEKGNKATDWTPAPEDTDGKIEELQVQVVGRNLLRYTKDLPIGANKIWSFSGSSTPLTDTEEGLKLTITKDASCLQVPLVYDGAVENGETVTLSFDYRGNLPDLGHIYFLQRTSPNILIRPSCKLTVSETEWQHCEVTFSSETANIRTCYGMLMFYGLAAYTGGWVEIKDKSLKLEKGTRATDWSEAPEDILAEANEYTESAIKDIQIGGRNLLKDSGSGIFLSNSDHTEVSLREKGKITTLTDGKGNAYKSVNSFLVKTPAEITEKIGAEYSFSVDVKVTGSFTDLVVETRIRNSDNSFSRPFIAFHDGETYDQWIRLKGIGAVDKVDAVLFHILVGWSGSTVGSTIEYRNFKLETGNKPTDWTPAPEDILVDANEYTDTEIEDIQIGGRNYFVRGNINNLAWVYAGGLAESASHRGYSFAVTEGEEWTVYRTDTTNNRWGFYWTTEEPVPGCASEFAFRDDEQAAYEVTKLTVPEGKTWCFIYLSNQADEVPNIMLEKGNKATDWSPAPEDILAEAKKYTDTEKAKYLPLTGGTMTGDVVLSNPKRIVGTCPDGTTGLLIGVSTASNILLGANGVYNHLFTYHSFIPGTSVSGQKSLGDSERFWKNLYLSGVLSDGTNSISVANIANKNNYLPLTGGTMTGSITIPDESYFKMSSGAGIRANDGGDLVLNANNGVVYLRPTASMYSSSGIRVGDNMLAPEISMTVSLGAYANMFKNLYLSGTLTDGTSSISVANIANKNNYLPLTGGTLTGSLVAPVYKSDDSAAAIKISSDNEISFGSSSNRLYIGYQNRVGSSGSVDTYIFGTHSGVNGEKNGTIICGTINAKSGIFSGTLSDGTNSIAVADIANKNNVPSKTESWTFTLEDGSTVTKAVYVG